ncbi:MAG: substrate-binding domain-containing protein [Planctomycetota bacterium]
MPRTPIYTQVMDAIERRVAAGEYMFRDIPGERRLATELDVSYMTARKAVLALIDEGVLARRENGTLIVSPDHQRRIARGQLALLMPAYPAAHLVRSRLAITMAAKNLGFQVRPFEYMYWDDPIVKECLESSNGLILIPSSEPIPDRLARQFAEPSSKVVAFDTDLSALGIVSIELFPDEHIRLVLDHLAELGRGRVECLNTQGRNEEVERRIGLWRNWIRTTHVDGALIDDPAPAYESALARAHKTMLGFLERRSDPVDTIFCTTSPAAIGAIRACADVGIRVGEDVRICAVNNEPSGRYSVPSITGLEMPDIQRTFDRLAGWLSGQEAAWAGPLALTPEAPVLFIGESTAGFRHAIA